MTTPEQEFNKHVVMVPTSLHSAGAWDVTLAVTLLGCSLVGIPGNVLALQHFLTNGRKDLATLLYIAITLVDTATCCSHFPITVSLLNYRKPVLFNNLPLCAGWTLLFKFLQRISIFLVTLLSVSRSIVIASPFMKLHKVGALVALVVYSVFLVSIDVAHLDLPSFRYISLGPFCTDSPLHSNKSYSSWVTAVKTLTTLELGVPSVITFFSFLVCALQLSRPCPDFIQKRRNRRASVTVAIFTGVFLFCNLPFFTLMVLNTLTRALNYHYPEPFFTGVFMSRYSWLLAKILLTVLNAALNPLVYYSRITEYRVWLLNRGFTTPPSSSGVEKEPSQEIVQGGTDATQASQLCSPTQIELVMLLPTQYIRGSSTNDEQEDTAD
ncbi:hypothetical protein ACHWQZ_G000180 [Mnemiopsis leidyi]